MIMIISSPSLLFFIIPTFHPIYAYHIPTLSCYYLRSSPLLSYALSCIYLPSYGHDLLSIYYICTSYIPSYCSTFRFLPIGHPTPLTSWHYPLSSSSLARYILIIFPTKFQVFLTLLLVDSST